MAITKTERIDRIEIHKATGTISLQILVEIDDPEDDTLPIRNRSQRIYQHSSDLSAEDQLIQDVAAAAWAIIPAPSPETTAS